MISHINPNKSNYIPSLLPYLGIIIDGAEDWVKAVNNARKSKLQIPQFSKEEEMFYEQIRNGVKLWKKDYNTLYDLMDKAYCESEHYFGSICKPIAKFLHLYDIYGVDTVNGALCGNTILCRYYSPFFKYDGNNGEYIKKMAEIDQLVGWLCVILKGFWITEPSGATIVMKLKAEPTSMPTEI